MPKISFKKSFPAVEVAAGANLMSALLKAGRPVASSCNGDGVCAKCRVEVTAGAENLSAPNRTELFLRERENLPAGLRISCQTKVLADVEVDTSYW